MDVCVICNQDDGLPTTCLREKGSQAINVAAQKRGDGLETAAGQFVHPKCRKSYNHPFNVTKAISTGQNSCSSNESCQPILRSKVQFYFATHCVLCGQVAKKDKKRSADIHIVRSMDFQNNIMDICKERNDSWALDILGRIESVNDLHAADAIYHQSCSINFRTMRRVPQIFSTSDEDSSKRSPGRPAYADDFFKNIVSFVENNPDEQVIVTSLVRKMRELCGDRAYTPKFMSKRLKDHFKDDIVIFERPGTAGVITLRKAVKTILKDFYQRPKSSLDDDKIEIIQCAAKLIKSEISSLEVDKEYYLSAECIASDEDNLSFVPKGLRTLLQSLLSDTKSNLKVSSIGQSIMQATRPRSFLPPLQLGLAVQLHHSYGSRSLIELLNILGFCSSYSEVQKFENSAAVGQGISIPGIQNNSSLQFMADNVDHDINTLDGTGTFHGMGIVAGVTPASSAKNRVKRIPATSDDVKAAGKIKLNYVYYSAPSTQVMDLTFPPLLEGTEEDESKRLDVLMKVLWPLKSPTPGWSGVWQVASKGDYPGKTSVVFLPMIDLNPSDPTCIFSTMQFVCDQALRYKFTPILTFDQPLFWKAFQIRENEQAVS